ncbi:MAG: hypothetical protein A2X02_10115 [Bacteroidetes bacterium GWF2_29_10]|nr:MAG: hypothetical protein A2X02_10115 [Bacteroidetes bacterium GWF2_29_10]
MLIFAEGTKEIMPTASSHGMIQIDPLSSDFAFDNGHKDYRLNISIKESGEIIYLGFGKILSYDFGYEEAVDDLYYRILDPTGNVVVNWTNIYSASSGHIYNYNQAVIGPSVLSSGGYNAAKYITKKTGDYWIEFDVKYQNGYSKKPGIDYVRREIAFFDITVANSSNIAQLGRVWSKAWYFTTGYKGLYDYAFSGKVFIYANDGIVTSLDLNGIKPLVFILASNENGAGKTGNFIEDRKSRFDENNEYTYPQYKVFLNDPDSILFPTGKIGKVTTDPSISGCFKDVSVDFSVNKKGNAMVLFDLNNEDGYQSGTADVYKSLVINTGKNSIKWDGKDGLGNYVAPNTDIKIQVTYINGLTNIPFNDVEQNPKGYIVKVVRPKITNDNLPLFWDDSKIGGSTNLNGCMATGGCHKWTCSFDYYTELPINSVGDGNTVNTWWYVSFISKNITHKLQYYSKIIPNITPEICNNSKGAIDITIDGDTNQLKYKWSTGDDTKSINNLKAGDYKVTVTNNVGCDTILLINVPKENYFGSKVTVSNIKDVTCFGDVNGEATVTPANNSLKYSYLWSSGETNNTPTNLVYGKNTVTITNSNGCDTIITVNIDQPNKITTSISNIKNVYCSGVNNGSATVNASGGNGNLSYTWNNGQNTTTINNLAIGTYIVTVKDAIGCLLTDTAIIAEANLFKASISPSSLKNISCFGENDGSVEISASGGIGSYNYTWSNGQNTYKATSLYASIYSVTVSDSALCDTVLNVNISQPTRLNSVILPSDVTNITCFGLNNGSAKVTSTGGNGGYSYLWSNGATSSTVNNLGKGVYNITVSDLNNCDTVISVTISEPVKLIVDIPLSDIKNNNCFGESKGSALVIASGGSGNYTYSWSNGNTNALAEKLSAGQYTVIVTDSNNCNAVAQAYISQPNDVAISFDIEETKCYGDNSGHIKAIVSGGTPDYSYSWSTGSNLNIITNVPANQYKLTITDLKGCKKQNEAVIHGYPKLSVNISKPNGFCLGDSIQLTATVTGGVSPYKYIWNNAYSGGANINILAKNYTFFFVKCIDNNGCEIVSDTTKIEFSEEKLKSEIQVVGNNPKCEQDTINIYVNVTGGVNNKLYYTWSDGNISVSNSRILTTKTNQRYFVTVRDNCNNMAYDSVDIKVFRKPYLDIASSVNKGCVPLDVIFNIASLNDSLFDPQLVLWSFGDSIVEQGNYLKHTYLNSGNYDVSCKIKTIENCSYNYDFDNYVEVFSFPTADFDYTPEMIEINNSMVEFENKSFDASIFYWTFGDNRVLSQNYSYIKNPMHEFSDTGKFYITLVAENDFGCRDSMTKTLEVKNGYTFYAPNAFTPTDGYVNDYFTPIIGEFQKDSYSISIFNRWGQIVFESNDINKPWDGKLNGNYAQSDIYIWLIKVKDLHGATKTHMGYITLIK